MGDKKRPGLIFKCSARTGLMGGFSLSTTRQRWMVVVDLNEGMPVPIATITCDDNSDERERFSSNHRHETHTMKHKSLKIRRILTKKMEKSVNELLHKAR